MLERLRNQIGTAGLVVAIVALVAALGGGAYAASSSNSGKATASAKGKPGPRGKTGKTGPAGPVGPAGPAGPAGPKGAQGAQGANGQPGAPGSPWTAGGTLPVGSTETGVWTAGPSHETTTFSAISFTIPLAGGLDSPHVHLIDPAGEEVTLGGKAPQPACIGSAAQPTAASGHLCVYEAFQTVTATFVSDLVVSPANNIVVPLGPASASSTGARIVGFSPPPAEGEKPEVMAWGSWAVTG